MKMKIRVFGERRHVGEFLCLKKIMLVKGLDGQEMPQGDVIKATVNNPYPCSGPKHQCVRCISNNLWCILPR